MSWGRVGGATATRRPPLAVEEDLACAVSISNQRRGARTQAIARLHRRLRQSASPGMRSAPRPTRRATFVRIEAFGRRRRRRPPADGPPRPSGGVRLRPSSSSPPRSIPHARRAATSTARQLVDARGTGDSHLGAASPLLRARRARRAILALCPVIGRHRRRTMIAAACARGRAWRRASGAALAPPAKMNARLGARRSVQRALTPRSSVDESIRGAPRAAPPSATPHPRASPPPRSATRKRAVARRSTARRYDHGPTIIDSRVERPRDSTASRQALLPPRVRPQRFRPCSASASCRRARRAARRRSPRRTAADGAPAALASRSRISPPVEPGRRARRWHDDRARRHEASGTRTDSIRNSSAALRPDARHRPTSAADSSGTQHRGRDAQRRRAARDRAPSRRRRRRRRAWSKVASASREPSTDAAELAVRLVHSPRRRAS